MWIGWPSLFLTRKRSIKVGHGHENEKASVEKNEANVSLRKLLWAIYVGVWHGGGSDIHTCSAYWYFNMMWERNGQDNAKPSKAKAVDDCLHMNNLACPNPDLIPFNFLPHQVLNPQIPCWPLLHLPFHSLWPGNWEVPRKDNKQWTNDIVYQRSPSLRLPGWTTTPGAACCAWWV